MAEQAPGESDLDNSAHVGLRKCLQIPKHMKTELYIQGFQFGGEYWFQFKNAINFDRQDPDQNATGIFIKSENLYSNDSGPRFQNGRALKSIGREYRILGKTVNAIISITSLSKSDRDFHGKWKSL